MQIKTDGIHMYTKTGTYVKLSTPAAIKVVYRVYRSLYPHKLYLSMLITEQIIRISHFKVFCKTRPGFEPLTSCFSRGHSKNYTMEALWCKLSAKVSCSRNISYPRYWQHHLIILMWKEAMHRAPSTMCLYMMARLLGTRESLVNSIYMDYRWNYVCNGIC